MSSASTVAPPRPSYTSSLSFSNWVQVGVAALAMVLTLPGRTHGLGLFTEPILQSLSLDRESYSFMNLWATLLGALFCLPFGWLLDRLGTRAVYVGVTGCLGITVMAMSLWTEGAPAFPLALNLSAWGGGTFELTVLGDLFLFLLLTRGLGQSALSVVSLALIGRAAGRRSGMAMGIFAVATTAGFMVAFTILGAIIKSFPNEWREPWAGIGLAVLVFGWLGGSLIRKHPALDDAAGEVALPTSEINYSLGQALRSATFWTFSVITSFYGLVVAGTSLFNESILAERGFDKNVFVHVTLIGIPIGLTANLLVGWLATRWRLSYLMAGGAGLLAVTLASFPMVTTEAEVYVYACALAAAGGAITVCFYTVYRQAFGPAHLGSIQGSAQMLTVLFSAVGPLLFASTKTRFGAYAEIFPVFAAIAAALTVLVILAGMPKRPQPAMQEHEQA